jgi:hypothetical protein
MMTDEPVELIEVDATEIRELLSHVDDATREQFMFTLALCNLPPIVVAIPTPSTKVH